MVTQETKRVLSISHSWKVTVEEAEEIQHSLQQSVVLSDKGDKIKKVVGVDCAYLEDTGIAAAVALTFPELKVIETAVVREKVNFSYLPGFLAFREGPLILEVVGKLKVVPDLFFFNGHGLAHPRGLGLASHLGVLLDRPSIGCARRLLGGFEQKWITVSRCLSLIESEGRNVAAFLKMSGRGKGLIVSPGHRVTLGTAISVVTQCLTSGTSLPLPLSLAHSLARQAKRKWINERGLPA
ncbi:MAG: endonuclease V [Candidatus Omnitrophica bacterium]|nr:endonuclease V [Candidatus Omnitrophota bacterium]